jgi:hypothetical protein
MLHCPASASLACMLASSCLPSLLRSCLLADNLLYLARSHCSSDLLFCFTDRLHAASFSRFSFGRPTVQLSTACLLAHLSACPIVLLARSAAFSFT